MDAFDEEISQTSNSFKEGIIVKEKTIHNGGHHVHTNINLHTPSLFLNERRMHEYDVSEARRVRSKKRENRKVPRKVREKIKFR